MRRTLQGMSGPCCFLAALLLVSGCAGLGRGIEPPGVHVVNIQPMEIKALEAVFRVDLRVINRNDVPLTLKGLDCDLELNDRRFASGVSGGNTEIPAYGTAVVPVVLYSSFLDVVKGFLGMGEKERLEYRIKGRVRLEAPGFSMPSPVPFESSGEVHLKGN